MTCRACLRRALTTGNQNLPSVSAVSLVRPFSTQLTRLNNVAGPSRLPPSRSAAVKEEQAGPIRSYTTMSIYRLRQFRNSSSRISSPSRRSASTKSIEVRTGPQHPLIITPPSLDAIKEEGYLEDDVQLVPESEAWINITPEAISQLAKITSKEPPELLAQNKLALRVGVESGGCHGYQYIMEIVEERRTDDYVMQPKDVDCIPVVVDLISLGLLKGATLHHATELIGSSFRLQDNPQAKEGGNCGCGVSWELK